MTTAKITITTSNSPATILEALKDPSPDLFKDIPDIVSFKAYRELGIYEIKIRLRRFLATVIDTISFVIKEEGGRVIYESLEPGKFRAVFSVSEEIGITKIDAEISYDTPLKGSAVDTAVAITFRKFIWNLDQMAPIIAQEKTLKKARELPGRIEGELIVKRITVKKGEEEPKPLTPQEKIPMASQPVTTTSYISCKTCLLYEANVNMCIYLMRKVEDPEKPLCGGEKYIKAST